MALKPDPHLSFEGWLEAERSALEERCEYVAGGIFW